MPKLPKSLQNTLTALGVLVFLGLLIYAGWRVDPEKIREWQQDAPVVPFFIALTFLPLIGVPTTPFFMVSGAAYGILVSLLGTAVALAVNLIISFGIARGGLSPLLQRLIAKTGHTLPDLEDKREIHFTFMVRMIPAMPNFVKNYLLCLAGISFPVYFGLSMIISMVYAAPFIILGESILEKDTSDLVIAVALLVALSGLTHWVRKKMQN
ncbi:MAG: hypothetical protein JJU05_16750 [Verrucomicrobia bacterium]|nr:hypothetical protein [Verrucomicrobiota bacterium]MCH8526380.1 hypothetical protein [Kiritimatiellia bacterium]